jgi:hypothetical protein
VSDRVRTYALAIAAGVISEGLLVAVIKGVGSGAQGASILLVLEAIVLGWVFGARPGAAGAVLPIVAFLVVDLFTASDGTSELAIAFYAVLLLGFCAWLPGVLRERYRRR